jgi:lipid-A-disaccharide synthase
MLVDDARAALLHSRASVVASGTATVEAALIGNPFVVVYRLSSLSYAIVKRFVTVPHVAMANLIAERRVVPELIQQEFTAANVVNALRPLLAEGAAREEVMAGLADIRARLEAHSPGETAIERAAAVCMELLSDTVSKGAESANRRGEAGASTQPAGTYQA